MNADDAVSVLQEVKRILSAKLNGISSAPWTLDHDGEAVLSGGRDQDWVVSPTEQCCGDEDQKISQKKNNPFIAMSRVAVPAMLRAIEAVLDMKIILITTDDPSAEINTAWIDGRVAERENVLIRLATELQPIIPKEVTK